MESLAACKLFAGPCGYLSLSLVEGPSSSSGSDKASGLGLQDFGTREA